MTDEKSRRQPFRFKHRADLMRNITVGTEIVATAHAYHPDLIGLTRVVTKVQTDGFYSKIKGQPEHKWSTCNHGRGFFTPYSKASFYRFNGGTVQVLNPRLQDGSVLYEMEVYPPAPQINEQTNNVKKEDNSMNEWDHLRRQAERMKQEYPAGTRILLINMGKDPRPVEAGTRGTVKAVDDIGTVHCDFDNGRQLGLIPGEDSFRRLTEQELNAERIQKEADALLESFQKETARLSNVNDPISLHVSPDFQCDQTGGYPCSLVVNWNENKAWLQLNDSVALECEDITPYERGCAEWGIRDCWDAEDFNGMLMSLGEDAMDSAWMNPDEDEGLVME